MRRRTRRAPTVSPWADLPRHYPDSAALRAAILERSGGACLLGFSGGKDSIAAWLALREAGFTRIVPYYLYDVPGLEFVEEGLRYFEDFFGTAIARLPHPSMARWVRNLVFQPPERAAAIEQMHWPALDYPHIYAHMRARAELPEALVAIGTRAADSPIRYANIRKHGSVNPARDRGTFLPVYDWRLKDVIDVLGRSRVALPVDYRMFGRSYDGIDYRFLRPIREHYPRDYERIVALFPLVVLEEKRRTLGRAPPVASAHASGRAS